MLRMTTAPCNSWCMTCGSPCGWTYGLQWMAALVFACLYMTDLVPPPLDDLGCGGNAFVCTILFTNSDVRQVLLITVICILTASTAIVYHSCQPSRKHFPKIAFRFDICIAVLNVLPVVLWTVVTISLLLQYDCPWTKFVESNGTCPNRWLLSWNSNLEDLYWNVVCHTICDTVGLVTARLARLDFGLCLLLAACGKWPWLHGATAGLVGYPEGMPLHRLTGYWCIGQSIVHSIAYLVHYYIRGGWLGIWQFCFPFDIAKTTTVNLNATASPFQNINRLGLINVYGVIAFFILLMILISAIPWIRKRSYTFFQYSHLPMSMIFILFAALHDLQWLYFGIPGLSEWFIGRVSRVDKLYFNQRCSSRKQAVVRVLPETSGPWVELKIALSKISSQDLITGSRSQWASLRIVELDHEFHPVSLV